MKQDVFHHSSGKGFDVQEKTDQDIGIDDDPPVTSFH